MQAAEHGLCGSKQITMFFTPLTSVVTTRVHDRPLTYYGKVAGRTYGNSFVAISLEPSSSVAHFHWWQGNPTVHAGNKIPRISTGKAVLAKTY